MIDEWLRSQGSSIDKVASYINIMSYDMTP